MEGLTLDEVVIQRNPLDLTLDEIIALNKAKNQQKEENVLAEDIVSVRSFATSNRGSLGINGRLPLKANNINNRLRSIPGFGSKPIHHRLGYTNYMKRRNRFKPYFNPRYALAQQSLNRAKMTMMKRGQMPLNPVITFTNPNAMKKPFISPLTRNSIDTFDRMHNNHYSRRPLGSTRSTFSFQRPTFFRHSINKCLNPQIQAQLQELILDGNKMDLDSLQDFRPSSETTVKTTHERFSTYV